jgi:hypothetical protein
MLGGTCNVGRDNVVGIATRYGLDRTGIASRWNREFPNPSRTVLGPPNLLYSRYRVSFPSVKRPGLVTEHPLLSSSEVKERVELYLYFQFGPSRQVMV